MIDKRLPYVYQGVGDTTAVTGLPSILFFLVFSALAAAITISCLAIPWADGSIFGQPEVLDDVALRSHSPDRTGNTA